jgi:2-acylglycerol O-acyltransferase 2
MGLDPPTSYHVLPMYAALPSTLGLPDDERRAVVASMVKHAGPDGFPRDSLAQLAPMVWYEELIVALAMLVWLGGPMVWAFGSVLALALGSNRLRVGVLILSAALAFHPMPGARFSAYLRSSRFALWLYKYFSYRFVWCDDDYEKASQGKPWIGAGPPHGVLPFANVLSIPAINTFAVRR